MSTVKLKNLKSDLSFNGDLQLDKNFILLPAKAVVSDDLIKVLTDWNFTEFQCSEEVPDFSSSQEKKQDSKASSESKVSTVKDSVKQALAKAGFFSADRTIEEYNNDIWHLTDDSSKQDSDINLK